jgi:hypothetical protein
MAHPELFIQDVRSFSGEHFAPIAPLTILVGENSSGKSTFLAMLRVAWAAVNGEGDIDFNEEPFTLGSFRNVLGSLSKELQFSVGLIIPSKTPDNRRISESIKGPVSIVFTFVDYESQPRIDKWTLACDDYSLVYTRDEASHSFEIVVRQQIRYKLSQRLFGEINSFSRLYNGWLFFQHMLSYESLEDPKPDKHHVEIIGFMLECINSALQSPYALAPVRSGAKRTYDPLTDKPKAGGEHVPMRLAKLKSQGMSDLRGYGIEAGLFSSLAVQRMGESQSDASLPFQIRVGMSDVNKDFNLIDVGHGVTQVLPVLVDALDKRQRLVLIQQPEVHLHPRAQAALGSFFVGLAREPGRAPVVIETHSDYIIDRVRMDVRDKKIGHEQVQILYFERSSGTSTIARIGLDPNGNLTDAPRGYRDFFLEEERRLFGF